MTHIHDNLPEADGTEKEVNANVNSTNEEGAGNENVNEEAENVEPETPKSEVTEPAVNDSNAEAAEEKIAEESSELKAESAAEVDDSESKDEDSSEMSDEELEKDDDHEEVESDEEEHEHTVVEELELPDYDHYDSEKLVDEAEKLLKNEAVHKIKAHFDSIRKNLLDHLNEEKKERLAEFLEGGGVEMDFEFIQPLRQRFKKIYTEYRNKRQAYYKDLQDRLENNLQIKKELIEKIKDIVSKDESIGDTFKEFNALQQEWRNTGPVPRSESGDLWRTYHHHVENFYEFIKINKELRDLDFKKNHQTKEALIEKVEALVNEPDIKKAFSELQDLHKKWKQVGPVEREHREPMWERFSAATKKMHERREEYYEDMKARNGEMIEQKKMLTKRIADFPFGNIKTHAKWQEAIKGVEAIRQEFRKIGRINHPENDAIWDEFREVLRDFNRQKNTFYKELKRDQQNNLAKKKGLLELAESLKESEDWRNTTNELKRIQAEWKKIGHVPRSESDKIWKQFREACNHFFNRLTAHNKDLDKALEGNLSTKQTMLDKLKAFKGSGDQKADVSSLKGMINEWKAVGRVPRDKGQIEAEFNKILDNQFKSIDLDRKESQRIRFENKMSSMAGDGNDDRQLRKEKDFLRKKLDEAKKELNTLETNMAFFSSSSSNNPFIKEAEKKIKNQQAVIDDIQEKMKMLTIAIRDMNKPKEEPQAEAPTDSGSEEAAE